MKNKKLVAKIEIEERDKTSSISMYLGGGFLIILGIGLFLLSIPLMLVIIGFFLAIGALFILIIGISIVSRAKYKPSIVVCPYCKHKMQIRYNTTAFTCLRCQERVLVSSKELAQKVANKI